LFKPSNCGKFYSFNFEKLGNFGFEHFVGDDTTAAGQGFFG